MLCEEFSESVDLYVDGELAAQESHALEAHVARCTGCAESLHRAQALKSRLRDMNTASMCPAELRSRIQGAMKTRQIGCEETKQNRFGVRRALLLAASVLLVGGGVTMLVAGGPASGDVADFADSEAKVAGFTAINSPVIQESIDWHRRDVPIEVTGPNTADVSDWLGHQVSFPVHLPSLSNANLLGGRLSNVSNTEAALAVYDVGGTELSVIAFDSSAVAGDGLEALGDDVFIDNRGGYNVAVWQREGVTYTFTSALPEQQLLDMVGSANFAD